MATAERLVFVWFGSSSHSECDAGIILTKNDYERCKRFGEAIETARTWGEFEGMLDDDSFSDLSIWVRNGGDRIYVKDDELLLADPAEPLSIEERREIEANGLVITPDMPFDAYAIPEVGDGDLPPWILAAESTVLPESVVEEFGEGMDTMQGSCWLYPEDRFEDLAEALRAVGYELERAA